MDVGKRERSQSFLYHWTDWGTKLGPGTNLTTGGFQCSCWRSLSVSMKSGLERPKVDLVSEEGLARLTRSVLGQFTASWTLEVYMYGEGAGDGESVYLEGPEVVIFRREWKILILTTYREEEG